MKKILNGMILAWICAMLIGFHAGIAKAEESAEVDFNRFSVGIIASYYNTASSEIGDVDADFDTSPAVGLSGAFFINPSFSVELYTHYLKFDLGVTHDNKSGTLGEIKQTPVFLTVRYQHPIEKLNANVYVGLGANYVKNDFNQKTKAGLYDFFGLNVSADMKDSFGWHANVGSEWYFMKHFSTYVDLKVIFNEAEVDLLYPDSTRQTCDMAINASVLGIGIRYYFF